MEMNKDFTLSSVNKARLRKHNKCSLTCFVLAIVLAFLTPQPWIAVGALYFLGKFLYRSYLLKTADPYLSLSDDGLAVRWSRSKFIPWVEVTQIMDTSKHIIADIYQPNDGENPH